MWNRDGGKLTIQTPLLISIYIPNILKLLQPDFYFQQFNAPFFQMRLIFWRNLGILHVCAYMHSCPCVGIVFMYFHLYLEGHFLPSESYFASLSLFFLLPLASPPVVLGMEPRMLCLLDRYSTSGLYLQLWCVSLKLTGFPFIPLYTFKQFNLSTRLPNTHFLPQQCIVSLSLLSLAYPFIESVSISINNLIKIES